MLLLSLIPLRIKVDIITTIAIIIYFISIHIFNIILIFNMILIVFAILILIVNYFLMPGLSCGN